MRSGLILFIGLALLSCDKTKDIGVQDLGYDYYPIEIGSYRIYDVEEIQYKLIGFDTLIYQLRETIFDSIVSTDQVSYLIRRDKRLTASDPWISDSVWLATRTPNFLSITENNIPFVKLTFPVETGREWNGNSLNTRTDLTYYYTDLDQPAIDSIDASDQIRMIIEDVPQNIVNQDERSEVYVRGIGLVEKNYLTLEFCTADCNELGEIEAGRFLNQVLIEVGNE